MSWAYHTSAYNKYCVLGSRIMVLPMQTSNNPNDLGASNAYTGVYLSERSTTTYTHRNQFMEASAAKGRGQWRQLAGMRNQVRSIKSKYSAKRFWNVKDVKDNNQFWSTTNSGPTGDNSAYYIIWYQNTDTSEGPVTIQLDYIMDFIVAFSEPKNMD